MDSTRYLAIACIVSAFQASTAIAGPCAGEVETLTKTLAATDAGAGPTSGGAGTAQPGAGPAQHPPAEIMAREAQGKAASPEDVRRQTQGQSTAAEQAKGARPPGTTNKAEASAALDRAKGLDRAGREAECMEAVKQAKRLMGS
ncbi:Hypothetical protein precursor [Bosea sp. LC85]|uniref:hypothetical protein n=1 Tax=Bosea sp. LC85 TaxID=1502851 RepID=UPI0004E436BF|nr:hypothetical protein [Bosea sp. LC85]KFC64653.1 Hypothetical protein precursor [Bosea sp. LC85]